MTLNDTIFELKRELIRAFAVLDTWFDKDEALLNFKLPDDHTIARNVLKQIMHTNNYMLSQISDGCSDAIKKARLGHLNRVIEEYTLGKLNFEDKEVQQFFDDIHKGYDENITAHSLLDIRLALRDQLDQCLCHLEIMKNGEGAFHSTTLSKNTDKKIDMYQWIHLIAVHAAKQLLKLHQMEVIYSSYSEIR